MPLLHGGGMNGCQMLARDAVPQFDQKPAERIHNIHRHLAEICGAGSRWSYPTELTEVHRNCFTQSLLATMAVF
jgi:hypothetical protein